MLQRELCTNSWFGFVCPNGFFSQVFSLCRFNFANLSGGAMLFLGRRGCRLETVQNKPLFCSLFLFGLLGTENNMITRVYRVQEFYYSLQVFICLPADLLGL